MHVDVKTLFGRVLTDGAIMSVGGASDSAFCLLNALHILCKMSVRY